MNYDSTTRVLTIDNYYDLVKFARKQDWEFDCNHPKKIIITMARKTAANLNTHHLDLRI